MQRYTVELVYESYDDENWYCTVEVEASSPEEAGKKAKAMSSSLDFYQVMHGPPKDLVMVDQIYTKTKIQ